MMSYLLFKVVPIYRKVKRMKYYSYRSGLFISRLFRQDRLALYFLQIFGVDPRRDKEEDARRNTEETAKHEGRAQSLGTPRTGPGRSPQGGSPRAPPVHCVKIASCHINVVIIIKGFRFSMNLFPLSMEDNKEKGKRLLVVFELLRTANSQ